jgi:hypothetical protein
VIWQAEVAAKDGMNCGAAAWIADRIAFQTGLGLMLAVFDDPTSHQLPLLPPAELKSLRRSPGRIGAFVLVTEDEPPLLEVVWRHFDGHPISGERLDAVPFHLPRGIRNDRMSDV